MNYVKIYTDLINKGLERGLNKRILDYYTESHHIIPKCLNGVDRKINRVLLTGREHFIAHKILVKMYPGCNGLIRALHRLLTDKRERKIASRDYEIIKQKYSELRKLDWSGNNHPTRGKPSWNSGMKLPDSMKELIRLGSIGIKKPGTSEKLKGRKRDPDLMKRISESNTGLKRDIAACTNIKLGQRKKPHWQFESELFLLWTKNDKIHFKKFRKIAVINGYPDVDYQGMVKAWIRDKPEEI